MDDDLVCNYRKCRKRLTNYGWVCLNEIQTDLSLSLSLSHTHTHTHTLSLSLSGHLLLTYPPLFCHFVFVEIFVLTELFQTYSVMRMV